MPKSYPSLGFPPGLLGNAPLRIEILAEGDDWIALNKPVGIGMRAHPWDAAVPDLDRALNHQLQRGVREYVDLKAEMLGSVYYLDPEISGVGLFAKTRAGLERLRNSFGSALLHFRFILVTESHSATGGATEFTCDLPLKADEKERRMHGSPREGKRAQTQFRRLGVSGKWALWEARCDFFRPHQVRVHGAASGLAPAGDPLYGRPEGGPGGADPYRGGRGGSAGVRSETLLLHLEEVVARESSGWEVKTLRATPPAALKTFLRKSELSLGDPV